MSERISICCVGDLILDQPGPFEPYFEGCRDTLCAQDVVIGHVETPHTTAERTEPSCIDVQAPPSPPEHLDCLPAVGFHIDEVAPSSDDLTDHDGGGQQIEEFDKGDSSLSGKQEGCDKACDDAAVDGKSAVPYGYHIVEGIF